MQVISVLSRKKTQMSITAPLCSIIVQSSSCTFDPVITRTYISLWQSKVSLDVS